MTSQAANRGEWSELYAIGYLIVNGGGYGADEFTKLDTSLFYKVLEIVDNPSGQAETYYKIHEEEVEIYQHGIAVIRLKKDSIVPKLSKFFTDLVLQSQAHAFTLPSGFEFMNLIHKNKLSASSSLSYDLHLILQDIETMTPSPKKGFSVKSEIGSPATIFNASHSTNLTYRIMGKGIPNPFAKVNSVKTNIKSLTKKGFKLKFEKFDNPIFEQSLANIDSNLPQYLSEVLLAYTESKTTKLQAICNLAFPEHDKDSKLKIQKVKRFLSAASMGLKAGTLWSGYPQDFGGMLLVKRNGDVLFYYLYNMIKFEEYLFQNLRFETPVAKRHGFGQIYEQNGIHFLKLNLQIRY